VEDCVYKSVAIHVIKEQKPEIWRKKWKKYVEEKIEPHFLNGGKEVSTKNIDLSLKIPLKV
jgi:hypothetical protein